MLSFVIVTEDKVLLLEQESQQRFKVKKTIDKLTFVAPKQTDVIVAVNETAFLIDDCVQGV